MKTLSIVKSIPPRDKWSCRLSPTLNSAITDGIPSTVHSFVLQLNVGSLEEMNGT